VISTTIQKADCVAENSANNADTFFQGWLQVW
jgi:hypothetical protein